MIINGLAHADHKSVISLIQNLVRIPTRAGLDPYDEIIDCVSKWLKHQSIAARQLRDQTTGRAVALVCDIEGEHPGPRYVLDACLDTAPFGDPTAWRHAPTSGTIEDGWLYGRGAADSKAAIAIFMHLAKHIHEHVAQLRGTLTLLFDADEHTGQFGGAKQYFGGADTPRNIQGVMIGYPGIDELVIGGRGFLRAELTVRGTAGHTGSQQATEGSNAIEKAAKLVQILARRSEPGPLDATLGLPPRLTVTGITGGESYSIIPDCCTVNVDVRLTTDFDETAAKKLITETATEIDNQWPSATRATTVTFHESWPAYRLTETAPIRVALQHAAQHHLHNELNAKVAGPSNIGNYLAKLGIDTTAGLGVRYKALHGTDERIDLATIPPVQATYHEAILALLTR
jgi:succinyl-diaminopimelate desuccinylase